MAIGGEFTIIPYNIEEKFMNPNVTLLQNLANSTGGNVTFEQNFDQLLEQLVADETYKTIQRENRVLSPLIDWWYLLIIMALALSCEWFIRKYNGLI